MKRLISALFLMASVAMGLSAQVDNYSLRLTDEGSVNIYKFPELNGLSDYTIQFWLNADQWTEGALIFSRGGDFKASLGSAGTVNFQCGSAVVGGSSATLAAGTWAHVTIIANGAGARVLVDGTEAGSTTTVMTIPASDADMIVGNGINGRIDELRFWKAELASDYEYFIYNTLNKYAPQWSDLVAYYKFDQNLCDNVVDYTYTYHHGTFSEGGGATREIVTDNDKFKYLMTSAYTNFERFFDRGIERDKYLLANDLIILNINSSSDGHLSMPYPYSEGMLVNATRLDQFQGRTGVLSVNCSGQGMNVGPEVMTPSGDWTFYTWLYLEEWTPGAYIFKKESADGLNGISIRLGEAPGEDGQLITRINGRDFPMNPTSRTTINTGEWVHVGIRTNLQDANLPERTLQYVVNGTGVFCVAGACGEGEVSYTPAGADDQDAIVGEGLNAKLDQTAFWHHNYDRNRIYAFGVNGSQMPGLGVTLTTDELKEGRANAYYTYDDADCPGYDYYSYKHFVAIMRSAYEGHRGYTIRMAVRSHSGWESTFADAQKRKTLAADLAEISKEFDGVELDFEWCYSSDCFRNYGMLLEEIKAVMPADKIFAVSLHAVSYGLATQYMDLSDFYTFQIYGPSRTQFTWSNYTNAFNNFEKQGFPKDKILLSFATTTSRAYYENGSEVSGSSPIGVRNNLLDGDYTPDQDQSTDANGYVRYFTGFNQTYERTKFVRDNGLRGIFYWDMGNDVKMNHPYNITKASSFAINSNVDSLVTHVDVYPQGSGLPQLKGEKKPQSRTLTIYPNPATDGQVTMSLPTGQTAHRISLYDAQGVCRMRIESDKPTIDIDSLDRGAYVVTVLTKQGHTYTGRVVKK